MLIQRTPRPVSHGLSSLIIPLLIVLLVMAVLLIGAYQADAQTLRLTGTQSLLVEWSPAGWAGVGTITLDLAIGPRWHLTYGHDRAWEVGGRYVEHDVSVTQVMARDRTATLGWRVKVPEEDPVRSIWYLLFAWRWGG